MSQRHPGLFINQSEVHGRGVFAAQTISAGEIIEICPVIVLPPEELPIIHKTTLHDYYFLWGEDEKECGIVLGYGSVYNHAYQPNAEYTPNYEDNTLTIYCLRDIGVGEEITLNYNGDPENESRIWFDEPREERD